MSRADKRQRPVPLTVAVVDDEAAARCLIARAMERRAPGAIETVLEGASGLDAIALRFGEPRPDVMIVNGLMSGMDGQDAVRAIRRREAADGLRRVPILFYSSDGWCIEAGLAAGADAGIRSPLATHELVAAVLSQAAKAQG